MAIILHVEEAAGTQSPTSKKLNHDLSLPMRVIRRHPPTVQKLVRQSSQALEATNKHLAVRSKQKSHPIISPSGDEKAILKGRADKCILSGQALSLRGASECTQEVGLQKGVQHISDCVTRTDTSLSGKDVGATRTLEMRGPHHLGKHGLDVW